MKRNLYPALVFFLFTCLLSPVHAENIGPENLLDGPDSDADTPVAAPVENEARESPTVDENDRNIALWVEETLRERIIPEFTPLGEEGRPLAWEDLTGLPFKTWAFIFFLFFITGSLLSTLFGFLANISMILSFLCILLALAAWALG